MNAPHPSGPALSLLVVKTRRLAEMRAFYAAIGVDFVEEQHGRGPVHFAGRLGETVFELYPLAGESTSAASSLDDPATRLGLAVERFDDVLAALRLLPGASVSEPKATEWGVRAIARDPDGRAVELSPR